MTAIFGRNAGLASGPDGDLAIESARYSTLADSNGDLAVYDALTGRFAPFYGATAADVAADLNKGSEEPTRYQWKDTLA